jgi:hypothetical protein
VAFSALVAGVGEVQVLDDYRPAVVGGGDGDDLADRGPHPPVSGRRRHASQVQVDGDGIADRVARSVEHPGVEMPVVHIDGHHRAVTQLCERCRLWRRDLPRRVQIPAGLVGGGPL